MVRYRQSLHLKSDRSRFGNEPPCQFSIRRQSRHRYKLLKRQRRLGRVKTDQSYDGAFLIGMQLVTVLDSECSLSSVCSFGPTRVHTMFCQVDMLAFAFLESNTRFTRCSSLAGVIFILHVRFCGSTNRASNKLSAAIRTHETELLEAHSRQ